MRSMKNTRRIKSFLFFVVMSVAVPLFAQNKSLYLVAGQSNAVGIGGTNATSKYYQCSGNACFEYDISKDRIVSLKDPVGQEWHSLEASRGSLCPAFADRYHSLSQEPVYLVMAARGGSSCHVKAELDNYGTWDSSGQVFNDAVEKTNKAIAKANTPLKGIIWLQGERDANAILDGQLSSMEYYTALKNLILRFRTIYGDKMPFYIVQTGYQLDRPIKGSLLVRKMQRAIANDMDGVYISYTDTNLFPEREWLLDRVHYTQEALNDIGKNVADFIYHQEQEIADLALWKGKYRLNYNSEAKNWNEALPIGNGTLGGMVFGRVGVDRIQLNEISMVNGDEKKMGDYQPLGDLYIYTPIGDYKNYRRILSLDDALCTVTFEDGEILYKREYFTSYLDSVMVMRLSSNKKEMIDASFSLLSPHANQVFYNNDEIYFEGTFDTGLQYSLRAKILCDGGEVQVKDKEISVKKANSISVILAAGTSFIFDHTKGFMGCSPVERLKKRISNAASIGYEDLLMRHKKDYQELFSRVKLSLGETMTSRPINERLSAYKSGEKDPALEALLFQYGRYLLISSSRKGGLPANLQGLWSQDMKPAWRCQYTTNINIQMNYWPAEVTNLSECHEPFFDWLEQVAQVQKKSDDPRLKTDYGWKAYSTMNMMGGNTGWAIHLPGPSWLVQHYYTHYAYTGDKAFLRHRAYPMLKELVEYWEHFLVETKDGKWITPEGWSPEHGPGLKEGDRTPYQGVSYDQQIIYDLFTNYINAANVLQLDQSYVRKIEKMRSKLLGPQIGKWGQLQEWMEDWDEPRDKHRHISHLFAVYPGRQISPEKTPDWAKAALVSLRSRGVKSTGWSTAWKISLYARLLQGDEAYQVIRQLFNESLDYNLFDLCPPFQIDGNFGYTAGVAEMLVQSHDGFIHLLPALPSGWKDGEVKGLRTIDGFVVDIVWKNRQVESVAVFSSLGKKCRLRMNGKEREFETVKGQCYKF